MSGASDAPVAKIRRTGHGGGGTIGRRPTPVRRDTSAAFGDRHVAIYPGFSGANNVVVPCRIFCGADPGRHFFIAGPASLRVEQGV